MDPQARGPATMEPPVVTSRVITIPAPPAKTIVGLHPADVVRQQTRRARQIVAASIVNNPALSLGLALTLGVVLGWLIKRR